MVEGMKNNYLVLGFFTIGVESTYFGASQNCVDFRFVVFGSRANYLINS